MLSSYPFFLLLPFFFSVASTQPVLKSPIAAALALPLHLRRPDTKRRSLTSSNNKPRHTHSSVPLMAEPNSMEEKKQAILPKQAFLYPFYITPSITHCYSSKTDQDIEEDNKTFQKNQALISTLQSDEGKIVFPLYNYNGFWFAGDYLRGLLAARDRFLARDDDVLLATSPKSGTTWMKALMFAIVNRWDCGKVKVGLNTMSPHELFPFLEGQFMGVTLPDMDLLPSPRMINTHVPFSLLPDSFKERGTKIVYVCREPKDNFVSWWYYREKIAPKDKNPLAMEEALDLYCSGMFPWGPVWEHMLSYWEEHKRRPNKILFLRYRDLKKDTLGTVKKLAEFMGFPFTQMEGEVEGVVDMCGFERLRDAEVNRTGKMGDGEYVYRNDVFFREGKVEGWRRHLDVDMVKKIDGITDMKLAGSGLTFD